MNEKFIDIILAILFGLLFGLLLGCTPEPKPEPQQVNQRIMVKRLLNKCDEYPEAQECKEPNDVQ